MTFFIFGSLENKSNSVLLSTAYLPPIEYFRYLLRYSNVTIEQHETYQKQTYRNRCEIYSEKGKMPLTIPVKKVFGNKTATRDIQLFNEEKWQQNHWRAIESAYLASPFFLYYRDDLEPFYHTRQENLLTFNANLIQIICRLIGLDVDIIFTDSFEKTPKDKIDLRIDISPKKPSTLKQFPKYIQVFEEKHGFIPNLSIIDLLFNLGPEAKSYLEKISL